MFYVKEEKRKGEKGRRNKGRNGRRIVVIKLMRDVCKSYLGKISPQQRQSENWSLSQYVLYFPISASACNLGHISLVGQFYYFCFINYLYKLPEVWDRWNSKNCEDNLFKLLPGSGLMSKHICCLIMKRHSIGYLF